MNISTENNPIHHTQRIKDELRQLIAHMREDVGKVTEPKAQELFESSAEVLTGMVHAFEEYAKKSEAAWRSDPLASCPEEEPANAAG